MGQVLSQHPYLRSQGVVNTVWLFSPVPSSAGNGVLDCGPSSAVRMASTLAVA